MIEPTERDRIVEEVKSGVHLPQIGEVTKVWEHTADDDNSNHEVNVLLRDEDLERRRVPIAVPVADMVAPPRKGDTVLVQFLDGVEDAPVVTNVLYNDVDRAPLGTEGIIRRRRGSLYTEMHPDGDWSRTAVKPSDDGTPSTKVEVDDSGSTTKVNIETDGDVVVDADGKVDVDAGSDVTVNASDNVSVDAGGDATVKATGKVTVDGDSVVLGAGGSAVARKGDPVADSDGNIIGSIAEGSSVTETE